MPDWIAGGDVIAGDFNIDAIGSPTVRTGPSCSRRSFGVCPNSGL